VSDAERLSVFSLLLLEPAKPGPVTLLGQDCHREVLGNRIAGLVGGVDG